MARSRILRWICSKSPPEETAWGAILGLWAGPILGFLYSCARIGPPGVLWFQGKGGETILTPRGRGILSVVFLAGSYAGIFGGWAIASWYRRKFAATKPPCEAMADEMWDRDCDG
ncbi:hypothetical protein [Aquisphaera insulae]|uniref:hypothetical protein n=1 Tax=Aquisphaera insulae TaxID=2712864 RepID=UPI0013EA3AAA|nr:hypothetical protein [Aquisphaera insulae]